MQWSEEAVEAAIREALAYHGIQHEFREAAINRATESIAALQPFIEPEWQDIASAPRDGTPLLARLKNPIPREGRPDLRSWDGVCAVFRHHGVASDGFDPGWSVAAPVGNGGFPDDWFDGWRPLPAPPASGGEKT